MKTNALVNSNDTYGELKLLMDAQLYHGFLDDIFFLTTLKKCAVKNQDYFDSNKLKKCTSNHETHNSRVIMNVCSYLCTHDSSLLQKSVWSSSQRKRFEFKQKETMDTLIYLKDLKTQLPAYYMHIQSTKLDELINCFSTETSTQINSGINVFLEYIIEAYEEAHTNDTTHTGAYTIPVKFEEKINLNNTNISEEQIYSALKSLSNQTNMIPPFIKPKQTDTKKPRYTLCRKQYSLLTDLLKYVNNRQTSNMSAESFMFI